MKYLNVEIPDEVKAALSDYSKISGIRMQKLVELSLVKYLKPKGVLSEVKQPVDYAK